ncbi:hypothetical protein B6N60_01991 [Richelia sinica FACHB-800]|uniref:Uncharacterized protein n=1 Tax=Richelia sinica FACHB-800 TaxID=1357546 RepID=A0A975T6T8_9NOST|nr:hypothetical protein B6N60_01991 [Richelia sinica FACHB-800]
MKLSKLVYGGDNNHGGYATLFPPMYPHTPTPPHP